MRILIGTLLAVVLAAAALNPGSPARAAETVIADSVADFSGSQGAGNWYYGYYATPWDPATFTQMNVYNTTDWYGKGPIWQEANSTPPWTLLWARGGHPNGTNNGMPEHWTVRRWMSEVAGKVTIRGHFAKEDGGCGNGVDGYVIVDGKAVWAAHIESFDTTGQDFSVTVDVSISSSVDLAIAPHEEADHCDSTTLTAQVVMPSPALRGKIQYEKVPVDSTSGLQLGGLVRRPAVGILVEAVNATDKKVLASTRTDENGNYEIRLKKDVNLYVRVKADLSGTKVVNPSSGSTYAIVGSTKSYKAATGLTVSLTALDRNRGSGPFNILEAIRLAGKRVRETDPSIKLPAVTIRWGTSYKGGTFFNAAKNEAYINGDRGADSDEFDDHVVIHEYGHFLAAKFSRDDTFGGDHRMGDALDPRVAWSEGWANFFCCAMLDNAQYVDTVGSNGSRVSGFNLEENRPSWDSPFYWSEHSVGGSLWDLYDSVDDAGDMTAQGFAPIWRGFHEQLPKFRWIYLIDMAEAMYNVDSGLGWVLTSILKERNIDYTPKATPPVPVPYPEDLRSKTVVAATIDSTVSKRANLDDSSDYYTFNLPRDGNVDIELKTTQSSTPKSANLDLYLFDNNGRQVAASAQAGGVNSTERISGPLKKGRYVVGVISYRYNKSDKLVGGGGTYNLTATY